MPLPIPQPLARGAPGCGFPWPWSVYRWLPGTPLATSHVADRTALAAELAGFLAALYRIDPAGGPPPGEHNFYRGGPLTVYDGETRRRAQGTRQVRSTPSAAAQVWEQALAATWHGSPVWFHGDIADGNLLVDQGRLSAVIDFGTSRRGGSRL